jgi:hypothetical protein
MGSGLAVDRCVYVRAGKRREGQSSALVWTEVLVLGCFGEFGFYAGEWCLDGAGGGEVVNMLMLIVGMFMV